MNIEQIQNRNGGWVEMKAFLAGGIHSKLSEIQ